MAKIFKNGLPEFKKRTKIGVFGGSFNPPHEGHKHVAMTALEKLRLDYILWMVSPQNPLKDNTDLPSVEERLHQSVIFFSHPQIIFTGFEEAIQTTRTYDSLNYLVKRYEDADFVWIMGSDGLENFHQWYAFEKIAGLMPIAIINRPTALNAYETAIFAQKYRHFRISEKDAARLVFYKPPCWCYIHGLLCEQSSTKLRNLAKS